MPKPWTLALRTDTLKFSTVRKGTVLMMIQRIKSRLLLSAATLALVSLTTAAAYAKSYDIEVRTPLKAGKVDLKPGKYTLVIQGENAVFSGQHRGESYTTPVRIENANTKFKATMMDSANGRIRFIELGGTTMRVQLVE
ncbi:MAG TPA: hypothetical protein VGL72_03825 [Bryobacteraceae bacterium]|jgi:hypothetical protein